MLVIMTCTPLNLTIVFPGAGSKPLPWIVTSLPNVPLPGDTAVITGPNTTENSLKAGVVSSLPARSRALTSKVCDSSDSPVNVTVVFEEKADHAPPFKRQEKSRLPAGVRLSVPTNVKVAVVSPISPRGPLVIWVSGAVKSTVKLVEAELEFPARSKIVTVTVSKPSVKGVNGL